MPSYTIVSPSVEIFGFGSNIGSASKIFGMPKNCPKDTRRFMFVLSSCVHLALRNAIVRASYPIVSCSCVDFV